MIITFAGLDMHRFATEIGVKERLSLFPASFLGLLPVYCYLTYLRDEK